MREPFTVRLDAGLVAAVRARAGEEGKGAADLVAAALQLYVAAGTAGAQRKALAREVDEPLLERLDQRLGRAVEGLRDIAVKANFDESLTLLVTQETLTFAWLSLSPSVPV